MPYDTQMDQQWAMFHYKKKKMVLTVKVNFKVNITMFLFGTFGDIIVYT